MFPLSLTPPLSPLLPFSSPKTLIPKTLIPKTLTRISPPPPPPPPLSSLSLRKPYLDRPLSCSSSPNPVSPIQVTDLVEKDYSFLESDSTATQQARIVAASGIGDGSRVLVAFPTVRFVDRVVGSGSSELVAAVHESLFVLAMIKENNDAVRCLHGGILDVVPKKFLPFDAVFACYFPGMGVSVNELVGSAAKWCSPGGRLVICFDQGRDIIEREHQKQYPDIATSNLPDKITLEKAADDHSFQITEFVDEPAFYLAVLKFCG